MGFMEGYRLASCYRREQTSGGGSCILVAPEVRFTELITLKQMSEESILECSAKKVTKTKVTIINIYRPPSRDVQSFLRILDNILNAIKNNKDKILLSGDYKICIYKSEQKKYSKKFFP